MTSAGPLILTQASSPAQAMRLLTTAVPSALRHGELAPPPLVAGDLAAVDVQDLAGDVGR
jgi:hypothetical protein